MKEQRSQSSDHSRGNKVSVRNHFRSHPCSFVEMKLSIFCPLPEILWDLGSKFMHYLTSGRNFREHSLQAAAMVLSADCNMFTLRFRVRNHSIKVWNPDFFQARSMLKVVYKDTSVAQWISALESSLFCLRRKGSYFKDDLGYHKSAHLRLSI